jgi:hypothetical protein
MMKARTFLTSGGIGDLVRLANRALHAKIHCTAFIGTLRRGYFLVRAILARAVFTPYAGTNVYATVSEFQPFLLLS